MDTQRSASQHAAHQSPLPEQVVSESMVPESTARGIQQREHSYGSHSNTQESRVARIARQQSVGRLIREAREVSGSTQAELAKRAGTSQPALARYENGTVSPSMTTLERLFRAAGARLEINFVPAESTVDLSRSRAKLLRDSREEILSLVHQIGASNVRVFGSVARGEDDEESDIDLLIDYDLKKGLRPVFRLGDSLEELLGESVDVAPVDLLKPAVAERALKEAVPL